MEDSNFKICNGKFVGYGKYTVPNSAIYEGYFYYGFLTGCCKVIYDSGDIYEGGFEGLNREGGGIYTFRDGRKYKGKWKNGLVCGIINDNITENVNVKCPKCLQNNSLNIDNFTSYDNCDEYCCVCLFNKANVFFPECKHIIVCNSCAKILPTIN